MRHESAWTGALDIDWMDGLVRAVNTIVIVGALEWDGKVCVHMRDAIDTNKKKCMAGSGDDAVSMDNGSVARGGE